MAENALLKKMKLKPGMRAAVLGAPEGYVKKLKPHPAKASISEKLEGDFDWIQLFVRALRTDGMLWISYPKGTSKLQTDLTRDKGWDSLKAHDLK